MTPRAFAAAAVALVCAVPARASDLAGARRQFTQAQGLYLQGRVRDALHAADDALAADSSYGPALSLRARAWMALGDAGRARDDAQRALSRLGRRRLDAEQLIAQGDAYLVLAKPHKALESFDAAADASQGSAEALAARSRAWVALGDSAKALQDADAALKLRPDAPLWLYARARILYESGDDAEAIKGLTQALSANRQFPFAYGLLGAALARKGDLVRAAKAYDIALSLDGEYDFAYLGRAALHLREGDRPAAMKDFEDAIRADAQDYAPFFNRAELLWGEGRKDEALSDYRSAMTASKITPEAALAIGDRYLTLGLWSDAIAAYTRAHDLGDPVPALLRRATAWESSGEPEKALGDLDQAVSTAPDDTKALAARGGLEGRLGRDKDALADLNHAVRLAPKDPSLLDARASYYARAGKPLLAIQDYGAALLADPNDAEAYNGRGALEANDYRAYDKAMDDVRRAIALQPRVAGYRFNLGMLRLKAGLFRMAVQSFDEALALKGPAARILQQRAEAKSRLGDHVGAKQDIEAAVQSDPKNAAIYDTLGLIRLRAHRYAQAAADLSQSLLLDDKRASAHLRRGEAYGALGRMKPALDDLERAVALSPHSAEAWTGLCQAQRLDGKLRDSQRSCDKALAADSQYGPAYLQRALTQLAARRFARVIEDADFAWQLGVRRPEALIAEAVADASTRRYREAHRAFLKALALDAYANSAYLGFAPGHPQGDDFLSAIADLDAALKKDSSDPYSFVVRADALYSAAQFDKAVLEYTKAMEVDGTIADAYVGRGMALTAQDALDAAQQDYLRAIELAPNDPVPRVRLSVVLTMRRNYKAALDQLAAATKIAPDDAAALLRAGNAYYFQHKYPQALDEYRAAAKADPLDPDALNGLGLGEYALKHHEAAIDAFSRAIALNPRCDRYYRNRAAVWTSMQKYGNAAGDFRTASLVNTDPTLVDQYQKLIQESESRAADGKSS